MRLVGATTFVLGVMAAGHVLVAQGSLETPAFEVASIRAVSASTPFMGSDFLRITEAGQLVGRLDLRGIIAFAYGIKGGERLVAAEPGISRSLLEHFVIWAVPPKTDSPPKREEVWAMARQLLAKRLALKMRIETELVDTTVLRVAKPGVLAPGLRPAPEGCTKLPEGANPFDAKLAEAYQRSCVLTYFNDHVRGIMTLSEFARSLSDYANHPILDRTDLKGTFAIDVNMSRASLLSMSRVPGQPFGPSSAPAFVDAVRDQMGLVTRTERQPVRLFVVEHVGPLVEN